MSNLFFRTNVAPYRIDTYNALHDKMDFEFYFLYKEDGSQKFNMQWQYDLCHFNPNFLKSFSLIKKHFKVCTEVGKIIRENNPDIVIVPEFKILALQVLLYKWLHRCEFKVISMCDDSYDNIQGNDFSNVHRWARKIVTPLLDNLLLVDTKVVDWYQKNYGKGIWLPIIRDERIEREKYREVFVRTDDFNHMFKLEGKKVLISVSRLVNLKNIERTINAINQCKEDFTYLIVGSGEEEQNLRKAAAKCNHRVVFAGRYEGDDIRALYNLADVFILASYLEPYGAVTNEALLAGCKCIVSSHCGSSCLIDEHNGVIINPYDETDIAEKIDVAMSSIVLCKELSVKGNLMSFTFEETINRLQNEIKLT